MTVTGPSVFEGAAARVSVELGEDVEDAEAAAAAVDVGEVEDAEAAASAFEVGEVEGENVEDVAEIEKIVC